jgi:DNA-directed RNA polymerase omega subunit
MNEAQKPDSVYRLVLLAAKRAEQLMEGAKPRLEDHSFAKPTTLALKEVDAGLVPWRVLTPEEYERLREEELLQKELEREREQALAPPPPPPSFAADEDEELEEEEEEELDEVPPDEELAELEEQGEDELLGGEE